MNKKRIVIIGATSSIAKHCMRLWVEEHPVDLILIGRNYNRLEQEMNDLKIRSPESTILMKEADFIKPSAIQKLVDELFAQQWQLIEIVLIAHGSLPKQEDCQINLITCHETLEVNALSPVLFAEAFAQHMKKANHGTIVLVGSVAGDRGRKSNYAYGAAKGLVTRYAQGMQHRFADSNVKVILIKPGPTDTPMTRNQSQIKSKLQLASVDQVAKEIVSGINRGKMVIYTPKKWQFIMMIIRHLPFFIFKKLDI